MKRTEMRLLALTLSVVLSLAGCGGGGGSAAPGAAPPVGGTTADLAITGFSPPQGGAGTVITVTGTGLNAVTSARVGVATATFNVDSATQVRVTVPPAAQSGRIELTASGRTALSAANFIVIGVPQVNAVAPTSLVVPGRITVTGINLDQVAQARLGGTALAIAGQSATSLALDVPAGATTGFLTLVGADGVPRQAAQQVTVIAPMTITSLSPTTVVQGQSLAVGGTGLNRAQSVRFANGATAAIATRSGSTSITVTVPATAASGTVTVLGDQNDSVTSSASVTVVPRIVVDNPGANSVPAAGAPVTLTGSGFGQVTSILVGTATATITARSDTQLTFEVPAGVNCGSISLQASTQPAVSGGSVIVGGGCALRVEGIEFAQVLSQTTADSRQRIVPSKETLVRVYVVSTSAGNAAPSVRLTGFAGATQLGTLTMAGPATVPALAVGAALPSTLRYDERQSFNAQLPASWVGAGLRVRIDVDPEQLYGPAVSAEAVPTVGTLTRLDLVIVPVRSGSFAPTMPAAQEVLNELIRRLPIPADRITVAVRAPYDLTSVTDGLDTESEWSAALSELNQLRQSEAPSKHYYGFVRRSGGGVAGIGYIGAPASLGWDSSGGWRRTMTHELGHNFGRRHAPCGGVSTSDPNYPYAGGAMGATPLFDSLADIIIAPSGTANATDVMGYCSGSWFSDYNYREVQDFLERRPNAAQSIAADEASDLIAVSGTIGLDGMTWAPVRALRGRARSVDAGDYLLRLQTVTGAEIEVAFEAFEVDHAMPPQKHFLVTLPNPGPLLAAEVRRGANVVPLRTGERVLAQSRSARPASAAFIDWRETADRLELLWDDAAYPYLTVTHVLGDARTVLVLNARGGRASIDLAAIARGGEFEFGLSDGLNTHISTAARR